MEIGQQRIKMTENLLADINPSDLKIDIYSNPHNHFAKHAIRITHKPTGIEVNCSGEKTLDLNKRKALEILREKLYEYEQKVH